MHPGVVSGDDVEPVGGVDDLAPVGFHDHLSSAVHRRVEGGEDVGRDQGGVVDEQRAALPHRPHQRAVHEQVPALRGLGVFTHQVRDGGVPVAGHGDQVTEGRLDHRGLAGAGRAVEQGGHPGRTQLPQRRHVRYPRDRARVVELPVRARHRPGDGCVVRPARRTGHRGGRSGGCDGATGRGRTAGRGIRRHRGDRGRRAGRGGPGRCGWQGGEVPGGWGGAVAGRPLGHQHGLAVRGEHGQGVRDRAGRAAQGAGDLPRGERVGGSLVEVHRHLAAQLTVGQTAGPDGRVGGGGGRCGHGTSPFAFRVRRRNEALGPDPVES